MVGGGFGLVVFGDGEEGLGVVVFNMVEGNGGGV